MLAVTQQEVSVARLHGRHVRIIIYFSAAEIDFLAGCLRFWIVRNVKRWKPFAPAATWAVALYFSLSVM